MSMWMLSHGAQERQEAEYTSVYEVRLLGLPVP